MISIAIEDKMCSKEFLIVYKWTPVFSRTAEEDFESQKLDNLVFILVILIHLYSCNSAFKAGGETPGGCLELQNCSYLFGYVSTTIHWVNVFHLSNLTMGGIHINDLNKIGVFQNILAI